MLGKFVSPSLFGRFTCNISRDTIRDFIDFIWFFVLNATFSNISAISPVLVVEEAGVPDQLPNPLSHPRPENAMN